MNFTLFRYDVNQILYFYFMTENKYKEPFNRFRFKPDFTDINGWFILILLVGTILFGIILIASYY
jgi:hypothetical protein